MILPLRLARWRAAGAGARGQGADTIDMPGALWTAMTHSKPHLPTKICIVCQRPFAWRKKWARDWESVRYCSERCRRAGPPDTA
ncbi:hypothetical protein GCM10022268_10920 [Sphingomonas cynarae]|uniref:DUF2256 domain-containing protein n=1 Tax=Sphingomonas cynarae TaxID=930197 RepID=A0ABP7DDW6_9SPHN